MAFFGTYAVILGAVGRDRSTLQVAKFGTPWGILHLVNMSDYFLEKVSMAAILEFRKILKNWRPFWNFVKF